MSIRKSLEALIEKYGGTCPEGNQIDEAIDALCACEIGGASSWNDLKDKPFYTEYSEMKEVASWSDLPFVEEQGCFMTNENIPTLKIGQSYEVTWNGAKYTATCVPFGSTDLSLGNASAIGGEDTGEPFFIGVSASIGVIAFPLDGSATLNLAISTQDITHHKLDANYYYQGLFLVTIKSSGDDYIADKTFAEISNAISCNQIPIAKINSAVYHLTTYTEGVNVEFNRFDLQLYEESGVSTYELWSGRITITDEDAIAVSTRSTQLN